MPAAGRVILREVALADIEEIAAFSEDRFGDALADAYLLGLRAALDRIADFPQASPLRDDFGGDVRCKVYRSHRILFELLENGDVVVLRILHHSRDVPRALRQ